MVPRLTFLGLLFGIENWLGMRLASSNDIVRNLQTLSNWPFRILEILGYCHAGLILGIVFCQDFSCPFNLLLRQRFRKWLNSTLFQCLIQFFKIDVGPVAKCRPHEVAGCFICIGFAAPITGIISECQFFYSFNPLIMIDNFLRPFLLLL